MPYVKSCCVANLTAKQLILDADNPRFRSEIDCEGYPLAHPRPQELVRRALLRQHGAQQLIESILRLGFLTMDRIVVRPAGPDQYVAVEGNRRLAAIKTILHETRYGIISPPQHILDTLDPLEVLVLDAEAEDMERTSLVLQGVRHISGARSWGPFQQGRLVHALVRDESMSLREAALSVGLSPSRVGTLWRGFLGLRQMMDDPEYGPNSTTDMFSYFEQAYLKLPVREWLGWDDESGRYVNADALHFFYASITPEYPGARPRLQAKDVRDRLPDVLLNEQAKTVFLKGEASINQAYAFTRNHADILDPFLESARNLMRQPEDLAYLLNSSDMRLLEKIHELTGKLLTENVST
jgi:hypothetical protein